jgi:hypothetical protein
VDGDTYPSYSYFDSDNHATETIDAAGHPSFSYPGSITRPNVPAVNGRVSG